MERDEAREVRRGQIGKGFAVLGSGELGLCPEKGFKGLFFFFPFLPSSDINFNLRDKRTLINFLFFRGEAVLAKAWLLPH